MTADNTMREIHHLGKRYEAPLAHNFFLAVVLVIPLIFGLYSVALGKDINWDLKNYHYYNAYAFLGHRLDFDIAPAQVQTFFNPLPDVPFYWMTQHFSSRLTGFIWGWLHGFNLVFIFLLFWQIARFSNAWIKLAIGLGLVLISGLAPGFTAELGNTMNDNLTSLFVLGALLLLMKAYGQMEDGKSRPAFWLVGLAGFAMGLGFGLKQTIIFYALGAAVAFIGFRTSWSNRILCGAVYGLAVLVGALLTGGWWWWTLWSHFGNPFFPLMNAVFHSPYARGVILPSLLKAGKHMPNSVFEVLVWPILFTLDTYRVSQLSFFDVRFALIYALAVVWLIVLLWRARRQASPVASASIADVFRKGQADYLLLFFLVGFVLWAAKSSVYRYLVPLELLVPLCFFIIAARLSSSYKMLAGLLAGAIVISSIAYRPYDWGRIAWGDPYFDVRTPPFVGDVSPHGAVVIMLGWSPTAYVIPQFPPEFRFIRPESNLSLIAGNVFSTQVEDLLKRYDGPLYVLYDSQDTSFNVEKSLARLGLNAEVGHCQLLALNTPDRLNMCELSRSGGRSPRRIEKHDQTHHSDPPLQ